MNQNRINNKQILSPEEMKNKIIKINNSFKLLSYKNENIIIFFLNL